MKARFLFLAAVMLGLASCQTEPEGLDVNVGGEEQIVTVKVNVPETETRAAGSDSALGVFDNGVLGTADDNTTMRYILQVYYKDGENFVKSEERKVEYSDGKSVAFDVRLVPERDYQFVVWADVVVNGKTDTDNHYNTADLTNVTLNNTWVAMDESRDAFTATEFIDNFNSSKVINITLKRPFAKLRVVTTDMKALNNLGIEPTKATVTYTEKHYDAFNAFAGKAINDSKNRDIKHENFAILPYGETGDNMTLFTDYFFAEDDATNFVLDVFDQNNQIIKSGEFTTDIYVKRNNLTTIKGNILTDGKGFDVIIDDAFAGESGKDDGETFANVDTAEELLDAINKGVENITLDGDIDLSDLLSAGTLATRAATDPTITVAAGKESTIDLGGFTLSATSTQTGKNYNMIDVRGTLTVKNGTITTKHEGDNMAWNNSTNVFNVTAGGVLNLEGVTAKNLGGSDMAFVAHLNNWGEVTLNVENSTLESTYIAVRVFNSGNDMNNVTIKNSTLKGKYCFWVHNYTKEDFGTEEKALAHQALLNFDIFNGTNTFEFTNSYGAAALYGFTNSIYFTADGNQIVADGFVMNAEGEYLITKMSGMSWFANEVNVNKNNFAGKTIKLAAAMDLNNENWTAIGTPEANFCGTFDGCDYTIKNLKILVSEGKEDKAYLGFFGYAKDATIKNVVFENVDINVACLDIDHSQGHIGAVAGSLEGTSTIENVTVKGDVKVEATFDANGASRVAVVAGGNSYGNVTMKNVHVIANEGSYLKANNNVGALAGQLQGKSVFEDCSSNIDVTGKKFFAGGIIGLAAGDQTFTSCHTTGDITITQGREGKAHDHFRVGGIAGGWADNVKTPLVVTNCSYTGKVSGKDFNGNEANPLDYAGYVGRGYTLANAGTTVNIDGTRYVQKYDGADKAGIYDVYDADGNLIVADGVAMNAKGEYLISKAAGLTWFSDQMNNKKNTFAGKTIKVVNDIDMAGVTYYGGSVASYPSYCFKGTFDGGEKVISNLTITVENDIHGAAALIPTLAGDGTTIKNVILRDVNISSSHYAAGIWGYTTSENCYINVTNCHVEGGTITGNICNGDNADKVGGIGGIFYDGIVSGCSVKGVTITGYRDTAGIVGWAADSRANIKNNSIENVTINVNNATNYKKYTKRSEYDVNNYVGEGVGKAKLEGNTGEATINWGSIAE